MEEKHILKKSPFYEEKGKMRNEKFFQNRPVISRDREINGGIYLGSAGHEAAVVDDEKDSELKNVYQKLMERLNIKAAEYGEIKNHILREVWGLVREVMPYNSDWVDQIQQKYPEPHQKIYLSVFLIHHDNSGEYGGGVCRHQALLTAYLLERLCKDGFLGGTVSVDRNVIKGEGGHAWVRYTNSVGKVFILDPAQEYIGPLLDMNENSKRWFYERPEDIDPSLKISKKTRNPIAGFNKWLRGK